MSLRSGKLFPQLIQIAGIGDATVWYVDSFSGGTVSDYTAAGPAKVNTVGSLGIATLITSNRKTYEIEKLSDEARANLVPSKL